MPLRRTRGKHFGASGKFFARAANLKKPRAQKTPADGKNYAALHGEGKIAARRPQARKNGIFFAKTFDTEARRRFLRTF